jgi:hypothetical protein
MTLPSSAALFSHRILLRGPLPIRGLNSSEVTEFVAVTPGGSQQLPPGVSAKGALGFRPITSIKSEEPPDRQNLALLLCHSWKLDKWSGVL